MTIYSAFAPAREIRASSKMTCIIARLGLNSCKARFPWLPSGNVISKILSYLFCRCVRPTITKEAHDAKIIRERAIAKKDKRRAEEKAAKALKEKCKQERAQMLLAGRNEVWGLYLTWASEVGNEIRENARNIRLAERVALEVALVQRGNRAAHRAARVLHNKLNAAEAWRIYLTWAATTGNPPREFLFNQRVKARLAERAAAAEKDRKENLPYYRSRLMKATTFRDDALKILTGKVVFPPENTKTYIVNKCLSFPKGQPALNVSIFETSWPKALKGFAPFKPDVHIVEHFIDQPLVAGLYQVYAPPVGDYLSYEPFTDFWSGGMLVYVRKSTKPKTPKRQLPDYNVSAATVCDTSHGVPQPPKLSMAVLQQIAALDKAADDDEAFEARLLQCASVVMPTFSTSNSVASVEGTMATLSGEAPLKGESKAIIDDLSDLALSEATIAAPSNWAPFEYNGFNSPTYPQGLNCVSCKSAIDFRDKRRNYQPYGSEIDGERRCERCTIIFKSDANTAKQLIAVHGTAAKPTVFKCACWQTARWCAKHKHLSKLKSTKDGKKCEKCIGD
jgi:hypothetical protein